MINLRASDGVVLGTFPVANAPTGIAFDGTNIWVSNLSNSVTKLRASDGTLVGTFPVTGSTSRLAFDGTNIWVANFTSNRVTKCPYFVALTDLDENSKTDFSIDHLLQAGNDIFNHNCLKDL